MSFDALAPHYRWMERLLAGGKLQRARTTFLEQVPAPRSVLLVGEGPGRFLVALRRRFPAAHVTCVDASAAMLKQASRALAQDGAGYGGVEFVCADLLSGPLPEGTYDLIVTHFFLDCFRSDQLDAIVAELARHAGPAAHWLLADFQLPESGWRRARASWMLRLMYGFFSRATGLPARALVDPAPHLARHGFRLHRRVESEWGLLHSDWWMRDAEQDLRCAHRAHATIVTAL